MNRVLRYFPRDARRTEARLDLQPYAAGMRYIF